MVSRYDPFDTQVVEYFVSLYAKPRRVNVGRLIVCEDNILNLCHGIGAILSRAVKYYNLVEHMTSWP